MDYYSSQISKLIEELSKLPGIGKKTAERLVVELKSEIEKIREQIQNIE